MHPNRLKKTAKYKNTDMEIDNYFTKKKRTAKIK